MKKIYVLFILFVMQNSFSQQLETVQIFPFGDTFYFAEQWDSYEGSPPGINPFVFYSENLICMGNSNPIEALIYNTENLSWNLENSVPVYGFYGSWKTARIRDGFIIFQLTDSNGIQIFTNDRVQSPEYFIEYDRIENQYGTNPFITENFLFFETTDKELFSIILNVDGSYVFHDIEETRQWLDDGMAEYLGYHRGGYNNDDNFFGDFPLDVLDSKSYYYSEIRNLLNFEYSSFPELDTLRNFEPIGYDNKGINYFYSFLPEPFDLLGRKRLQDDFQIVVAIVDTWTRNVIFRVLPERNWSPPFREVANSVRLIGQYPNTVHPNGDIYFVDADLELQEYQIKRLSNDWWAELGIDEREILRIDGNHIPLRLEPDSSQNNGYNFENEFVWVQEHQGEWLRVRKIDGREGWILESETYDEGY